VDVLVAQASDIMSKSHPARHGMVLLKIAVVGSDPGCGWMMKSVDGN
jgi:hypothetical protein